jgi:hypothetical protein
MKSKDPSVVANATQRADMFLHNTEGTTTFNADGLRVKTNKTIINKKAFESNPTQNDAMSPGKTAWGDTYFDYSTVASRSIDEHRP